MSDLDPVEPCGNQRLETVPTPSVGRVRPNRESTRLMCDRDCVLDGKPVLRDESTPVVAKVCHERISEIVHDATSNERPRNVRPADRSPVCFQQHFVECNGYSQCVELLDNSLGAREPHQAQFRQSLLQGVELRQMERQQMDFVILVERAELDSSDYSDSDPVAGLAGRGYSRDRVVVSECECLEAAPLSSLDYLFWWESPVRGGRVSMQVDERRPARLCAHFA